MNPIEVYNRLEDLSRDAPLHSAISIVNGQSPVRLALNIGDDLRKMSEHKTAALDFFYDIMMFGSKLEKGCNVSLKREVYGHFSGVVPGRAGYFWEETPAVLFPSSALHGVLISNRAFLPPDKPLYDEMSEQNLSGETIYRTLRELHEELHGPVRILALGTPGGRLGTELGVFAFASEGERAVCTYLPIEWIGGVAGSSVLRRPREEPHRILERQ